MKKQRCQIPIGASGLEVDSDLAGLLQGLQVAAHPGLVGDDVGVPCVGLPIAPVGTGGVVHGAARDVEQLLPVADQQGDPQRGSAGVQVDRPDHRVAVGQFQYVAEELEQFSLFGTRRESTLVTSGSITVQWCSALPASVPAHSWGVSPSLVTLLCCPSRRPRCHVHTSDSVRASPSAVESSRDSGRPIRSSHQCDNNMTATPGTSGCPELTNDPDQPTKKGMDTS